MPDAGVVVFLCVTYQRHSTLMINPSDRFDHTVFLGSVRLADSEQQSESRALNGRCCRQRLFLRHTDTYFETQRVREGDQHCDRV